MTGAPARLAVYGTLAPGEPNAAVLADLAGRWARGRVRGHRYEDGWRGYPGLVLDDHAGWVPVAVLASPALATAWDRLDAFEGPGYRRVVADVTLLGGDVVAAHVYVLRGAPSSRG